MGKAHYRLIQKSEGLFELYEDGKFLVKFTRDTFRSELEKLNRSSNWIGSILRLFHNKYPLPSPVIVRSDLERLVDRLKEEGLADYLRAKGFRVIKPLWVSDRELISFLESKGYAIDGLLDGAYYSTADEALDVKALVEDKAL
ncbi:MAG: hypothetical protein A2Z47_09705 [Thermodesulfovibrio sp. RBG_19FT_COMBO_42_12]|nr:MAG: hypothetical protein A2Z47_09705 [Thermodesulfovibrio sp. RBG_19FT_COMBO_42_12]